MTTLSILFYLLASTSFSTLFRSSLYKKFTKFIIEHTNVIFKLIFENLFILTLLCFELIQQVANIVIISLIKNNAYKQDKKTNF